MKQKTLFAIALLTGLTAIISCEEENELKHNTPSSTSIKSHKTGTDFISNGFSKEQLIQHAYEAYANWYGVTLTTKNTKMIDNTTLQTWVNANEKNKHESINQKNQAALAQLADQGEVYALLVTPPAGAKFKQSVFVISRFTAVLITDVIDITDINNFWPRVALVGIGFKGNGFYDSSGNFIHCICVEEYKIVYSADDITHCRNCSVLDDNPF